MLAVSLLVLQQPSAILYVKCKSEQTHEDKEWCVF